MSAEMLWCSYVISILKISSWQEWCAARWKLYRAGKSSCPEKTRGWKQLLAGAGLFQNGFPSHMEKVVCSRKAAWLKKKFWLETILGWKKACVSLERAWHEIKISEVNMWWNLRPKEGKPERSWQETSKTNKNQFSQCLDTKHKPDTSVEL